MGISYGSITVTDITDITDVYFEYSLAVSSATVTNSYAFNQVGELGWTINGQSRKVPPTWVEGYRIWVREVKIKADVAEKIYGTPYPDTAVNEISNNLVEYLDSQGLTLDILNSKIRYMWRNLQNHTHAVDGWTKPDYPAGTYAASGKYNSVLNRYTIDYEDSSTYGFNTYLSNTALNLRYDNINMTTLSTSDLTFYYPKQVSGTYVQGESGLKLSTDGLILYNRGDGTEASRVAATLNINGLQITNGSIILGNTSDTTAGSIALSNIDFIRTINGTSRSNLRFAIGSKFGVQNDGTIYASGANIAGSIEANTGSIGGSSGWTVESQKIYSTGVSIGNNGSMYLGTKNLGAATINNVQRSDWRFTIGSKFGIDSEGNIYADGANLTNVTISGIPADIGKQANIYNFIQHEAIGNVPGWHRLGFLTSNGNSSIFKIRIESGDGFNALPRQNSTIDIEIKDAWQAEESIGPSQAFGVTVNRINGINRQTLIDGSTNNTFVDVKVIATAHNKCVVWVYIPWNYPNGYYCVSGQYDTWENDQLVQLTMPTIASGQVEQEVAFTNRSDTYITYINATDGIKVHNANDNLNYVQLNSNGLKIYSGNANIPVATFLSNYTCIGKSDGSQSFLYLDYHSIQMFEKGVTINNGNPYFSVSDLRNINGQAEITEEFLAGDMISEVIERDLTFNSGAKITSVVTDGFDPTSYDIQKVGEISKTGSQVVNQNYSETITFTGDTTIIVTYPIQTLNSVTVNGQTHTAEKTEDEYAFELTNPDGIQVGDTIVVSYLIGKGINLGSGYTIDTILVNNNVLSESSYSVYGTYLIFNTTIASNASIKIQHTTNVYFLSGYISQQADINSVVLTNSDGTTTTLTSQYTREYDSTLKKTGIIISVSLENVTNILVSYQPYGYDLVYTPDDVFEVLVNNTEETNYLIVDNFVVFDYNTTSNTITISFRTDIKNSFTLGFIPQSNSMVVKKNTSTTISSSSYTINANKLIFNSDYTLESTDKLTVSYITTSNLAKSFTYGYRLTNSNIGGFSVAEGQNIVASAPFSYAQGSDGKATGTFSHVEGYSNESNGESSHAEGYKTKAESAAAHAEGRETKATNIYTHAEGYRTIATGAGAHAEGYLSTAYGAQSHAGGYNSIAKQSYSYTSGYYTVANKVAQTVIGTFNSIDNSTTTYHPSKNSAYGTYAFIIGNGTSNTKRSDAFKVSWYGSVYPAGYIELGNNRAYRVETRKGAPVEAMWMSTLNNLNVGNNSYNLILRGKQHHSKATYILSDAGNFQIKGFIRCGGRIYAGGRVYLLNDTTLRGWKNGKTWNDSYAIAHLSTNNNVVIGDSNTNLILRGKNNDTLGTYDYILNSDGDLSLKGNVYAMGNLTIKTTSTTTSDVNARIATSDPVGRLYRHVSSSRRYKHDIKDIGVSTRKAASALDPTLLYNVQVRQFKYNSDYLSKDDARSDIDVPGLIAEELNEIYPIAVDKDENGIPENWNIKMIVPPMIKLIQDQHRQIEDLEERLSKLENK